MTPPASARSLTADDQRPTPDTQNPAPKTQHLSFLFAAALFVSASLLFWVQPLVAKSVLPLLGGTPAVWNTCMLFFQGVLLAGYAYVFVSTRRLGARRQSALHLALLLLAAAVVVWTLPEGVAGAAARREPGEESAPALWLLWTLLLTLGLPLFVISASAPLLQGWFSRLGHARARDPYFLYAASNAGSLLALAAFPLLLEPAWTVDEQGRLWAVGFGALALLVAACALALWRAGEPDAETNEQAIRAQDSATDERASREQHAARSVGALAGDAGGGELSWRRRLLWAALAFAPSSLVLGLTTYATTDLAAVPLLWVVPLALYLLTFVLAFARRRFVPPGLASRLLPGAAIILALVYLSGATEPALFLLLVHLAFFFLAAYVCHARLADERPAAAHLAEYYLWVSLGGALGGLFNAILAPLLFDSVLEYPLAVVLACLLRPPAAEAVKVEVKKIAGTKSPLGLLGEDDGAERAAEVAAGGEAEVTVAESPAAVSHDAEAEAAERRARRLDLLLPLAVGVLVALLSALSARLSIGSVEKLALALGAPLALVNHLFTKRRVRFALGLAAVMLASGLFFNEPGARTLLAERNFFGTLRVTYDPSDATRRLQHGSTIHGRQFADASKACEPLSYYHKAGPLGSLFEFFNASAVAPRVAAVGLGTGASVAHARAGQEWTFYEIDPAVVRLASDERYFTYLKDCAAAPVKIVTGDARLQLRRAPDGEFGLILLDAFSSDAVPAHLLTREALALYLSKLAPGGLVAFHVSNRSLRLDSVVAALAADAGLPALVFDDLKPDATVGKAPSQWAVVARRPEDLRELARDGRWRPLEPQPQGREPWTDKFSNIVSVLRW